LPALPTIPDVPSVTTYTQDSVRFTGTISLNILTVISIISGSSIFIGAVYQPVTVLALFSGTGGASSTYLVSTTADLLDTTSFTQAIPATSNDLILSTVPATSSSLLVNKYGYASCAYSFQHTDGNKCGTQPANNKVGCACSNTDYVTLDRTNDKGTAGLCYVGPADATELRLLTLRKQPMGAIFGWPSGVGTLSLDQSYVPSLVITDYATTNDGTFTYAQKMISEFSSMSSVTIENNYAGVSHSASAVPKFRNCAGKTSADLTFDSSSYVFWVEYEATDGYAIARSDYTEGIFVTPVPVWKQGATLGGSQSADNLIVGISFADNGGSKSDSKDILYAASTTRVYATTTHYKAAVDIVWYEIVTIGIGESAQFGGGYAGKFVHGSTFLGSEHRGISTTPSSSCNSDASIFRALEEEVEEEADQAETQA